MIWPDARLGTVARTKLLAGAIPGAGYAEAIFDAPYAEAWPRLADLERSVPTADKLVRRLAIRDRRTLPDGADELRFVTTSPLGWRLAFTARLEDGFCLMQGARRLYIVVMAAEPTEDGRTRFAQLEGVPKPGGRLLRPLMRLTVGDDIKGFRNIAEESPQV